MKKILLLIMAFITMAACKNTAKNENALVQEPEKTMLKLGCYGYDKNGNTIKMEITDLSKNITGNLRIAYTGKDVNQGTFAGTLEGDKLIGIYTFTSEGMESKREMAFLVKDDQLIEGYGDLNENGTAFKDINTIKYSSTMPLTKEDCPK